MSLPQSTPRVRRSVGGREGGRQESNTDGDKRKQHPYSRRPTSENDYHNLPEITWNTEVFNFEVDDFLQTNPPMSHGPMVTNTPIMEGVTVVPASKDSTSRKSSLNSSPQLHRNDSVSNNCSGADQEAQASPPKKTMRPCAHCGKAFNRSYDLHRHESSHSSERPYACEHPGCTKKYKLRQDLKAHERSAHQGRGGGGAVVLGYWQGYEDRLYSM